MSPTAGMLEGDRVEMDISVESNANLVVSNPTALRIHRMNTGKAVWKQTFRVASQGFLETHPEWIIPQAQSRFEQHTRLEVDTNSRLFFIEALAPGRVASGEAFAFDRLQNRLEVHFDSRLIALEKSDISPTSGSQSGWQAAHEKPYTYSLYVSAPELVKNDEFFQFIHEQQTPTLLSGSSKLDNAPCWNIKIVSESSVEAKAALGLIRDQFYRAINLPIVDLRK
jgi:urease accessory protein